MKDYLLDIVNNTAVMGPLTILKIIGTDDSTKIKAKVEDGTIILDATLNKPIEDFKGVFGLSNLPMLSGLLNFPGFRDKDATVNIKRESRNNVDIPSEIIFKARSGATASYRLTHEAMVPTQYNHQDFDFAVVVEQPQKSKISELTQLAGIYAGQEERFTVRTVGTDLKFFIGNEDASSHKASFTFASNVEGTIKPGWSWPINDILGVLKLSEGATSKLSICNQGVLQIDIDTGLCKYKFMFPGGN